MSEDYNKAREYYEKGCELNNSESFNKIGNLYYYGKGVDKNYNRAVYYFTKAITLNNTIYLSYLKEAYEKLSIKDKRKCYSYFINVNNEEIKEILDKDFKIYVSNNTIDKIYDKIYEKYYDINILFNEN